MVESGLSVLATLILLGLVSVVAYAMGRWIWLRITEAEANGVKFDRERSSRPSADGAVRVIAPAPKAPRRSSRVGPRERGPGTTDTGDQRGIEGATTEQPRELKDPATRSNASAGSLASEDPPDPVFMAATVAEPTPEAAPTEKHSDRRGETAAPLADISASNVIAEQDSEGAQVSADTHPPHSPMFTEAATAASAPASAKSLFICYRREDTGDATGRLHDRLSTAFGSHRIFMDIDSVPLGVDFVGHVTEQIAGCCAVVVMIGRQWVIVKDRQGRVRLHNDGDLVRMEVAAALRLKVPVIPVLVQEAEMPHADELPDDIRSLARRNGIELSATRWHTDVERLIKDLERVMTS